jgi:hypothetical protein
VDGEHIDIAVIRILVLDELGVILARPELDVVLDEVPLMDENSVAARVVGHGVRKPKHVTLREQAAKERDPVRRQELRAQASAAKAAYNRRITGKAAEEKARNALERARWRRENGS